MAAQVALRRAQDNEDARRASPTFRPGEISLGNLDNVAIIQSSESEISSENALPLSPPPPHRNRETSFASSADNIPNSVTDNELTLSENDERIENPSSSNIVTDLIDTQVQIEKYIEQQLQNITEFQRSRIPGEGKNLFS